MKYKVEREKVLAVLLVISLCANAYLILGDTSALKEAVTPILFPVAGASSNSSFDGEEGVLTFDGEPGPEETRPPDSVPEEIQEPDTAPEETPETTPEQTPEPTPDPGIITLVNYSSARFPFSLQYPSNWNISEKDTGSPQGALLLTAPAEKECPRGDTQCYLYTASMVIEVVPEPGTPNPEDYFTASIAALQAKYTITSTTKSAPCYLSGTRAYQIEFYTRDERGNPEKSYMQYYGIFDGRAYILSYIGPYSTWENVYSKNKGDAQRIVDSFVVERTYKEVS